MGRKSREKRERRKDGVAVPQDSSPRELNWNSRIDDIVVRPLEDGSRKILVSPARPKSSGWHNPRTYVPSTQWCDQTQTNRYEFERIKTPQRQISFFALMGREYENNPPTPLSAEDHAELRGMTEILPNGLNSYSDPQRAMEIISKTDRNWVSPDGLWKFGVSAESMGGQLYDVLRVTHADLRTLPDWNLLIRFRSWILPDTRTVIIVMPGSMEKYTNDRFNCIQMMSPRPLGIRKKKGSG